MTRSPIQTQGALFEAVQRSQLFGDSKTFPDATALHPPQDIEASFRALLSDFIRENFQTEFEQAAVEIPQSRSMGEHIDGLWNILERHPDAGSDGSSSLIGLPNSYVVPGGRFREIYYWDSYFTCEGLAACGRIDLVESMLANFAFLIEQYGHIPNGNRSYYLSRSQPPFFWKMLQLLEREKGFESIITYLPHLEKEYGYWMDAQSERVIRLENENRLNRYWDARNLPREEAHREDIELFERAGAERQADIYRNLRAGAESGWDFSSRWLDESRALESIRTTDILPVDLNCLLYGMERQLGAWLTRVAPARASGYLDAAEQRKNAIQKYCWNEAQGWFFDYSWRDGKQTQIWSLAGLYPLYCGLADQQQSRKIAQHTREKFLKPGGVVTTLNETGQQWDSPNGWAPLQWITVQGLLDYDQKPLAVEIARRFVNLAESVYQSTGKMMEKYNVCRLDLEAGGGEYPLQDGFGWTNGVVRRFMELLSISP